MKVQNINSNINVKNTVWNKMVQRLSFLAKIPSKIPFYLVNEDTMDKICPPKKTFNEECLKEIIKNIDEKIKKYESIQELENLWKMVEECQKNIYKNVGCYSKNGAQFLKINEPSIFICPERIYNNTSKPEVIIQKVGIHEIVHAYIDRKFKEVFESVIEESLANAIAFIHFKENEKNEIMKFINEQPVEYKGCYFWLMYDNLKLSFILKSWKEDKFLTLFLFSLYFPLEIQPVEILIFWKFYRNVLYFPFSSASPKFLWDLYMHCKNKNDILPFLQLLSIDILKYAMI
jgi:hypothetical protein